MTSYLVHYLPTSLRQVRIGKKVMSARPLICVWGSELGAAGIASMTDQRRGTRRLAGGYAEFTNMVSCIPFVTFRCHEGVMMVELSPSGEEARHVAALTSPETADGHALISPISDFGLFRCPTM